jgi:hypothetical protein
LLTLFLLALRARSPARRYSHKKFVNNVDPAAPPEWPSLGNDFGGTRSYFNFSKQLESFQLDATSKLRWLAIKIQQAIGVALFVCCGLLVYNITARVWRVEDSCKATFGSCVWDALGEGSTKLYFLEGISRPSCGFGYAHHPDASVRESGWERCSELVREE